MVSGRSVRVGIVLSLATVGNAVLHAQVPAALSTSVDPAEKKLLGAEGLLGRAQYDLARQEFDSFLKEFPTDVRATRAKYGRGVAEYNLNELRGAESDLAAAAADKKFE